MTTTYELYTNENGTPKAVEGKAPAILERVEALEGTLNNGVVTSVNGNTGDITPEQTGCLPLSGGTMTGNLKIANNKEIQKSTDANFLAIYGGTGYRKGSRLILGGKDNDTYRGKFSLVADDGTTEMMLTGNVATGNLVWRDSNVITSAGGTFTGDIKASTTDFITKTDDTGHLTFVGGTAWNKGGALLLRGMSESTGAGRFELYAHNGTNSAVLIGNPNGSLTWANSNVVTLAKPLVPNYRAGVSISSGYTAPSAGIVMVKGVGNYTGYTSINVNGHEVAVYKATAQLDSSGTAWVNKGDKVTFRNGGSSAAALFYPLKIGG